MAATYYWLFDSGAWFDRWRWHEIRRRQQVRILKGFVLIAFILLLFVLTSTAQCTTQPGFVCITQIAANDMAAKLDELKSSRDVIAKFMVERATNAGELAAAKQVIEGWKALDAINVSMLQKYEAVATMYERVIKMQADLIDKLTAKINAPKSAWQKFVQVLKEIAILAAGIYIGKGL